MIDGSSNIAYNINFGEGGVDKFLQLTDEIDKTNEEIQQELELQKNKTVADLTPFEQLLLNFDSCLNNFKKLEENKKYNFFRDQQFKQYVRDAYGVNI